MNPMNIGFWYPIRAVTDPITQLKIDLIWGTNDKKLTRIIRNVSYKRRIKIFY